MSIQKTYPLSYCFGERQAPMTQEELAKATPSVRLQSVWPRLASMAMSFQKTLKPQERVAFDFEDILSELAAEILKRDHEWDPSRGKYITYATTMISHALYALRDRTPIVNPPPNSSSRIKQYNTETCTERKRKTADDIQRAARGATELFMHRNHDESDCDHLEPSVGPYPDTLEESELAEETLETLKRAIKRIDPLEAKVIGRLFGLWGQKQANEHLLAIELGFTEADIRKIKARGMAKMRKLLTGGSK